MVRTKRDSTMKETKIEFPHVVYDKDWKVYNIYYFDDKFEFCIEERNTLRKATRRCSELKKLGLATSLTLPFIAYENNYYQLHFIAQNGIIDNLLFRDPERATLYRNKMLNGEQIPGVAL